MRITSERNDSFSGPFYKLNVRELKEILEEMKEIISVLIRTSEIDEPLDMMPENMWCTAPLFVTTAINLVIDRSVESPRLVGMLMTACLKQGAITPIELQEGFCMSFQNDSIREDIPLIRNYEIIEPIFAESDSVDVLKFLIEMGDCHWFSLKQLLQTIIKIRGKVATRILWLNYGLTWPDHDCSLEREEITENNSQHCAATCPESLKTQLTHCAMKQEFTALLQTDVNSGQIFDWIALNIGRNDINTPGFVSSLVTSILSVAIEGYGMTCCVNSCKLEQCMPILRKYLNNHTSQKHALSAVHSFFNEHCFSLSTMKHVLETLYGEGLVSENALKQWENCYKFKSYPVGLA